MIIVVFAGLKLRKTIKNRRLLGWKVFSSVRPKRISTNYIPSDIYVAVVAFMG